MSVTKKDDVYLIYYITTGGVCGLLGPWLHAPTVLEQESVVSDSLGDSYPDEVTWKVKKVDLYDDAKDGYGLIQL